MDDFVTWLLTAAFDVAMTLLQLLRNPVVLVLATGSFAYGVMVAASADLLAIPRLMGAAGVGVYVGLVYPLWLAAMLPPGGNTSVVLLVLMTVPAFTLLALLAGLALELALLKLRRFVEARERAS